MKLEQYIKEKFRQFDSESAEIELLLAAAGIMEAVLAANLNPPEGIALMDERFEDKGFTADDVDFLTTPQAGDESPLVIIRAFIENQKEQEEKSRAGFRFEPQTDNRPNKVLEMRQKQDPEYCFLTPIDPEFEQRKIIWESADYKTIDLVKDINSEYLEIARCYFAEINPENSRRNGLRFVASEVGLDYPVVKEMLFGLLFVLSYEPPPDQLQEFQAAGELLWKELEPFMDSPEDDLPAGGDLAA